MIVIGFVEIGAESFGFRLGFALFLLAAAVIVFLDGFIVVFLNGFLLLVLGFGLLKRDFSS
jgi:hypothetical protein